LHEINFKGIFMSFTQTMECLIDGLGQATGEAIRTEINNLLGMPNIDLTALQQAVAAIQSLLDSDPTTEGFQTGQNIITQLVALGNRLDALENSTVVAQLQVLVNSINVALAAEVADRQAADQLLQDAITNLSGQIENLQSQVSVLNQTGGECDCAAIAAQISGLETAIANLTGTDAAQAAQIAGLQTQLATLSGQVAAAATAAAAAEASAAAALAAANSASSSVAALQTAVNALDDRETERHNGHGGRLNALEAHMADVNSADCTALIARFRTNIAVGLAA
jgi:chromosome segregation ATPase